jgi:hypothetical protein
MTKTNGICKSLESNGVARLGKITTKWVFVTPRLAVNYKEKMGPNRQHMESLSDRFAHDMLNGFWEITHQGIAIDESGQTIDSQHRLDAIIKSGVGQWMLVTSGLSARAQRAIDTGRNRTLAHAMQIEGDSLGTPWLVGVARRMYAGPASRASAAGSKIRLPDSALREFIDEHRAALNFSNEIVDAKRLRTVAFGAVIARAFYSVNHEELRRFVRAVLDDIPAIEMRDGDRSARRIASLTTGDVGGYCAQAEVYRKVQNALRAYLNNVSLKRLDETKEDLFPLPVEEETPSLSVVA